MKFKDALLLLFIWFPALTLQGQQKGTQIMHYIFPAFIRGSVLMKDGTSHEALLNYNAASEEMIFDQNGQKLAFAEVTLNGFDTVFIDGRKFVLADNKKFAEVIHQNGYSLLVEYKCRVVPPGKAAGYGGTSQTSAVTSYSSVMGGGQLYELKLPDDFKVNPYKIYWIEKEGKRSSFLSLRQLRRHYSEQKTRYNSFVKENDVDFDKTESMHQLIHYMETDSQKQ